MKRAASSMIGNAEFFEKLLVLRELVMLPQMQTHPGAANGPDTTQAVHRRRRAVDIRNVVQHPTFTAVTPSQPIIAPNFSHTIPPTSPTTQNQHNNKIFSQKLINPFSITKNFLPTLKPSYP
jgi:hypothetical protein